MGRDGAYRPSGFSHKDIKEMAGICVDTKDIERVSNQIGKQVEVFYKKEAALSLSGKIVPIESIPRMYICMNGTGVPVVKSETVNRKGKGEDGHAKAREAKLGCVFTLTLQKHCIDFLVISKQPF